MIIISKKANSNIFKIVARYIGYNHSYGSPPIHYWYRNVVEAVRLIDDGFDKDEGIYKGPLEKSLGDVYYGVRYVGEEAVCIVTDFDFNFATIRSYLNRARVAMRTNTTKPTTLLYSNPNKQIVHSHVMHGIITESVKSVLNEISSEKLGAAAIEAQNRINQKFYGGKGFNPFRAAKLKGNTDFENDIARRARFLSARDAAFVREHPGVVDPHKDYSSPQGVATIPSAFDFEYNDGKNQMQSYYGRPKSAYYSDDPDSYDERWNEKRVGKGRKAMSDMERANYERAKEDLMKYK